MTPPTIPNLGDTVQAHTRAGVIQGICCEVWRNSKGEPTIDIQDGSWIYTINLTQIEIEIVKKK